MANTTESHTAVVRELIAAPRLVDLLEAYHGHLLGKGHRPSGRAKYMWNLKAFIRWTGEDVTTLDLTEERITAYRDARAVTVKAAVVFNELTVIRSLCKWCVRKRYLAEDPTVYVDFPKVPRPSPRALKRAQLKQLFAIIDTEPTTYKANWRRNRLILLIFIYTGARISEGAGLRWGDIDLDANTIKIRGEIAKNGRTRAIPMHPRLKEELSRLPVYPDDAPVFTHIYADGFGTGLDVKSLAHVFERWLPKMGLAITAHQLRHTLATELLRAGAPLPDIQGILGHDSLETTAIYLTVDSEHLRGSMNLLPAAW